MNGKQAVQYVQERLKNAGIEEYRFETDIILEHVLKKNRFDVDIVDEQEWTQIQNITEQRAEHKPLQYLLGAWGFLSLDLAVGPGVLIPRPETEEVCMAAAEMLTALKLQKMEILDLCSGSGAIALGLQSIFPDAKITAVELDKEAYSYLETNTNAFGANGASTPQCVCDDAFEYHKQLTAGTLDLIISNPPYVTEAEYTLLAPELLYEPKQALVAANDGLLFYQEIAKEYKFALKNGGLLVLEIGSGQGEAVRNILLEWGFQEVEVRRDYSGNDRIVIGVNR